METTYITAKETNKLIRAALKKAFPTVKFSVKSDTTSSTNIRWMDGPTTQAVEKVANQYQSKRFDGMVDYAFSVTHWLLPDGSAVLEHNPGSACTGGVYEAAANEKPHPYAKKVKFMNGYVFCNRDKSASFLETIVSCTKDYWGVRQPVEIDTYEDGSAFIKNDFFVETANEYMATLVHRAASRLTA